MRVAVCADMEGLSGIDRVEHCFPAWGEHYRHGVRMLIGDLEAAVNGAMEAGATEVVLADWHYLGRNIPTPAFPDLTIRRLWQGGRPLIGPQGLGSPDAAVLVGVHAGAGNPEGFLSHTFWRGMSVLLDETPVSEAALWALALGGDGVPVVALAGDQRAIDEAAGLLPGTASVSVKAGTSRTSALLRPPPDAREEIEEVVRKALEQPAEPTTHPFPAVATIRFAEANNAASAAQRGIGERTGPTDVSTRIGSVHDLMPFLARGLMATRLGEAPRLGDALFPRRTGPSARVWTTCLLALSGWVERRTVRAWADEDPASYPRVGAEAGTS